MVGSEFLQAFKHVWDRSPDFFTAILNDPTQVVLVIEANQGGTSRSASSGCTTSTSWRGTPS
jgi:hypothetical protein